MRPRAPVDRRRAGRLRRDAGVVALVGAAGLLGVRCIPSLGPGDAQVSAARILAVRATPAEAKPGTKVTFEALVGSRDGTLHPTLAWSFCLAPKPLTQDNVVDDRCVLGGDLAATSDAGGGAGEASDASALTDAGVGATVAAKLPSKGCEIYGPAVGAMGLRPRDPDATGGYYQPLLAALPGQTGTIELARIHCDLANASADAVSAFTKAYRDNDNPSLLPLTARLGDASGPVVSLTAVPRGARVTLQASWPPASAQTFAYYDPSAQAVTSQRESLQVAWYATAGTLDTESTGRASSDPATTSDNGWTAPDAAGAVHLWVVLRDSRGGVDWVDGEARVQP